ncbi:MAG: hypothetical protein ACM3VS_09195 [Candidatus Dadabacteria bacterium]
MIEFEKYLVPYLVSQVAAVIIIMIAYKNTRIGRALFALMFLWASITNFSIGFTNPDVYLEYSKMSIHLYRDFINGWFHQYNNIIIPLIAFGQLLIAIGMTLKGKWVNWACAGAIIFLMGIAPLGVGSAFPFSLIVSVAAMIIWRRDKKDWLWKKTTLFKTPSTETPAYSAAWILTIVAILLSIVACVTPYFTSIYHDNAFVQSAWKGNDFVTLLFVLPAFIITLMVNKSPKAAYVWMGLLGYLVYNYSFYLFGAAFNSLFPVYLGIVATSLYGLIALASRLPAHKMVVGDIPRKVIISYLVLIALVLFMVEFPPSMNYWFTGKLPDIVVKSGHPTSVVYALDLTLVVPTCVLAVYWMAKQKRWGFILANMMLVKGACYGLVLCAGTLLLRSKQIDYDPLLPFYMFVALGGMIGLIAFVRSMTLHLPVELKEEVPTGTIKIMTIPTEHLNS